MTDTGSNPTDGQQTTPGPPRRGDTGARTPSGSDPWSPARGGADVSLAQPRPSDMSKDNEVRTTPGEAQSAPREGADGGLADAQGPDDGTPVGKDRPNREHRDAARTPAGRAQVRTPGGRREMINRAWQVVLSVFGVATLAVVVAALIYSRADLRGTAALADCVHAWNATANGRARYALRTASSTLVGTPRQRMWMGKLRGSCSLAYVQADGTGALWRQVGQTFVVRTVPPTADDYRFAARAATQPNVTVTTATASDPAIGSLKAW